MTDINPNILKDVQGDILRNGFPKKAEMFCFFTIRDPKAFCQNIKKIKIWTGEDVAKLRAEIEAAKNKARTKNTKSELVPNAQTNIAFTFKGLQKIKPLADGIKDLTQSAPSFVKGMQADQKVLGDPVFTSDVFKPKKESLDGVLVVAGSDLNTVDNELTKVLSSLNANGADVVEELGKEIGWERKSEPGREHFGFEDGISHPQVFGLDDQKLPAIDEVVQAFDVSKGKDTSNFVQPGVILVGRKGEHLGPVNGGLKDKPKWMNDGSFLVFRKLEQHVGAWDEFMEKNFTNAKLDSAKQLGARFMGRWQSGCPLTVNTTQDKGLSKDKTGNVTVDKKIALKNDFIYGGQQTPGPCPLGAHIRKSHIRDKLPSSRIMRRGIPYGDDFIKGNPDTGRGLLFAAYQSTIEDGYRFIQQFWANNPDFPTTDKSGFDITIGQIQGSGTEKSFVGTDEPVEVESMNRFVKPLGGEYFFAPAVGVLKAGFDLSTPQP